MNMSVADPGPAGGLAAAAPATTEKIARPVEEDVTDRHSRKRIADVDEVVIGEPSLADEKTRTTRFEIWAYYAYYIGNNGVGDPCP